MLCADAKAGVNSSVGKSAFPFCLHVHTALSGHGGSASCSRVCTSGRLPLTCWTPTPPSSGPAKSRPREPRQWPVEGSSALQARTYLGGGPRAGACRGVDSPLGRRRKRRPGSCTPVRAPACMGCGFAASTALSCDVQKAGSWCRRLGWKSKEAGS